MTKLQLMLVNLAVRLIARILHPDLWNAIKSLVRNAEQSQEPGNDKRDIVLNALQTLKKEALEELPGWLIGLALEAAVANLKANQ
jgi:hypothetical protein